VQLLSHVLCGSRGDTKHEVLLQPGRPLLLLVQSRLRPTQYPTYRGEHLVISARREPGNQPRKEKRMYTTLLSGLFYRVQQLMMV